MSNNQLNRKISFSLHGEALRVYPKAVLTNEIRKIISVNKSLIIKLIGKSGAKLPNQIFQMGLYWEYSIEDLDYAFRHALVDPASWQILCEIDSRQQRWGIEING